MDDKTMSCGGENIVSFLNLVKDVKEGESTCPSKELTNNQTLMSA